MILCFTNQSIISLNIFKSKITTMEKLIQKKQRVLVIWVLFLFVMVSASQQRTQISMNFADGIYTRTPAHLHLYESDNFSAENLTSKNSIKNENFGLFDEILHLKKQNNNTKIEPNFQKLTRKETRQLRREIKKSIKNEIKKYIKDIKKANKWKTWQVVLFLAIIVGIIVSVAFFWSSFGWIVALVLLCLMCAVGGCGSSTSSRGGVSSGSGGKCRSLTCNNGKVYTTNGTYKCLSCNGTGYR